jgi:hypothetical protein
LPTVLYGGDLAVILLMLVLNEKVYVMLETRFDLDALVNAVMACREHRGLPTLVAA